MCFFLFSVMIKKDSCFFFSSRRRHTRCSRDWSSDVCSSDLSSVKPRTVMSSIMRARNALTGRGEGAEVIGGVLFELKVAGPSMLGIGCPDRHPLPLIHSPPLPKMHPPRRRPPARAGSFPAPYLPFAAPVIQRQPRAMAHASRTERQGNRAHVFGRQSRSLRLHLRQFFCALEATVQCG